GRDASVPITQIDAKDVVACSRVMSGSRKDPVKAASFYFLRGDPVAASKAIGRPATDSAFALEEDMEARGRPAEPSGRITDSAPAAEIKTKRKPEAAALGLVAHWKFDDGSRRRATDSSGNEHHGAIVGARSTPRGKLGRALDFDGGDDYMAVRRALPVDFSRVFTVSLWAKLDSISMYDPLIGVTQDSGNYAFCLCIENGLKLYTKLNGGLDATGVHSTRVRPGVWYHFAAVMGANNNCTIYVNGAGEMSTNITQRNNRGILHIARMANAGAWTEKIDGLIDDVRVYRQALSREEVRRVFDGGPPVDAAKETVEATPATPATPATAATTAMDAMDAMEAAAAAAAAAVTGAMEATPAAAAKATEDAKTVDANRKKATTFYVSQSTGNDSWTGQAASRSGDRGPWKTLARASTTYVPGDRILLKCGDTWNEELRPKGSGTPSKPITIGSYGKGKKPVIDRQDYRQDRSGIHLVDQGGFKIVGIEFNRCMTGIYGEYSDGCPTKRFIWVEDCYFHDALLYQHYEDYPRRKIGLGICFFSHERDKKIVLADITIKNCVFRRLASAIWTNSPDNFNKNASYVYNFQNMTMEDCLFEEGFQWQQGIRGVDKGLMRNCVTHDIGRGFRSFNGVAGSMFFRCKDWVFEDCEWGFVSIGLGSGDGEAFDFEGNCDRMTMRNCLFHDTDGPGFLLCCYASDGHAHSAIVMENCLINGKSKRPIGLPRCAIVNTTDWNESTWKNCRFYLSRGEALMRVMDPEREKKTTFVDCIVKDLSAACSTRKLPARASVVSRAAREKAATAWQAEASEDRWIQLDFGRATRVNEFRIKEDPSSSVIRYCIEYRDVKSSTWISCFNGRAIGGDFVAPIISRTMTKARLRVMQTKSGKSKIVEFAAYNDTSGKKFSLTRGSPGPNYVGK
ncbi:MAG: LamG-like jellyroll fold domain-containing protein, partial [Planctomycetota bacterium]